MESDVMLEKENETEKIPKKNRINLEKDSIQYNAQDLDQEQKVDVNPVQLNTQKLCVYISNDKNNYSGKITGTAYLESSKEAAVNINISLYFGRDRELPVYKTNSDLNGNFVIEDIPPGYYTLVGELGENLKYESYYFKVFAGQNTDHTILLK